MLQAGMEKMLGGNTLIERIDLRCHSKYIPEQTETLQQHLEMLIGWTV